MKEAEEIASILTYELSSNANVIWGARIREDYEERVRVMAIMTGIQSTQIPGPQVEPGILEPSAEADPIQEKRFGRLSVEARKAGTAGPLRKKHEESIIDFIN